MTIDPGAFEHWITVSQPLSVMPPKGGSSGSFDRWIAGEPFPSYAVGTIPILGAASQTLGAVGQAASTSVHFGYVASVQLFWVDIEDQDGHRFGSGPLRPVGQPAFNITKVLSASGEFSFDVSAADPNLDSLALKRTAILRYFIDGRIQVFGGGVIDKITARATPAGLVYTVSGNDLGRELTYRSVGQLDLSGAGAGVTDGPAQVMALAPTGWSLAGALTTETAIYAGLDGDSVLNVLVQIKDKIGEHWRLGAGREVVWLGPASGFMHSGIRAVQHVNDPVEAEEAEDIAVIANLEEEADATSLLTRIYPRGSGNGGVVFTLAAATDSAPAGYTLDTVNNYLESDAGASAYGRIEQAIDFKGAGPLSNTTIDIQAAANALLWNAYQYLRLYGSIPHFYKIGLISVKQLLEPGTLLRVVYRQIIDGTVVYDLDDDLIILSTRRTLDSSGLHTTQVQVATIDRMPASDGNTLASQVQSSRILSVHQQLGPSVDTLTWRDELDNSYPASFRFWLGNEYTTLRQAMLRFRILPLRSTVKSVGGASTTTDANVGANTEAIGEHSHALTTHLSSGANYTETVDSHFHYLNPHTHTLTPVISTVYGIFEASGGNTLAIGNLVIKLNGGSDLAGAVSDIGNGWYALDLTAELVDVVYRPAQENNEVVVSTATAKTARIEAQLTISGVVQAVNYL